MPNFVKLFEKQYFWPIVIFFAASVFRLFSLNLIEFKYDEAYTVFEINQFYQKPYLMQVGPPQSTGVYNPPLFNYLLIVFSFISRDPQFLSFVIAMVNTIFIVIFYLTIKKFYSNSTAIFSSLFLAFSPWAITFSRKIWIPDLLFPFTVLFMYFFNFVALKKEIKATLPLFAILALLPQIHASGIFFLAVTLIVILLFRIRIGIKKAFLGFMIGLTPAIPYFIRQISSSTFCPDCKAFFAYNNIGRPFDIHNFIRPFEIISGLNWQARLGEDYLAFLQTLPFPPLIKLIFLIQAILPIAGVVILVKYKRVHLPFAIYPPLTTLLYFLTKTPSYMHYFVLTMPITFIFSGLLFSKIMEIAKGGFQKLIIVGIFSTMLITNFIFMFSFHKFLNDKKEIKGDYGPIYSVTKQLVEENTKQYYLLPNYNEVKSYIHMFANQQIINSKLGEYFAQKGQVNLAAGEFQKALQINNTDVFSRANLTYIYILQGKKEEAKTNLDILSAQDSTISAKLKEIMEQK